MKKNNKKRYKPKEKNVVLLNKYYEQVKDQIDYGKRNNSFGLD